MCGIFGWHGNNPRTYNPYKIAILGLLNDSRGGDGCGLSVNGQIKKSAGKIEKFSEFLSEEVYNFLLSNKENTVLGHARKTSIGLSNLQNTHPFGHGEYKDGYEVILTHNGTIHNYTDLAQKYEIDIEGGTDSYMLSKFLHEDFDKFLKILSEYNGAAAIAAYDRVKNVFIVFKGESKKWESAQTTEEERPLHLAYVDKSNFYYSSEEKHLIAAGFPKEKIINLKTNTVFVFQNGNLISKYEVDRSKAIQNKAYKSSVAIVSKNNYGQSSIGFTNNRLTYSQEDYDDYYYEAYGSYYGQHQSYVEKNKENQWDKYRSKPKDGGTTTKTVDSMMSSYKKIEEGKQIYFHKNRYYIVGGLIANGYCYLDNSGKVLPYSIYRDPNTVKFIYFKDGIPFVRYANDIDLTVLKRNSELLAYPTFVSKKRTTYIVNPGKNSLEMSLNRKEGFIPLFDRDKSGNLIGFLEKPIIVKQAKKVNKFDLYAVYDSYILSKDKFDIAFEKEILKTRPAEAVEAFNIIRSLEDENLKITMEEGDMDLDEIKNILGDDFDII